MPRETRVIASERILLVEGLDEVRSLTPLLIHLGLADVQIIDYEGRYRFRGFLEGFVRDRGFAQVRVVCVCRDANGDANAAFDSVRDALLSQNQAVPDVACQLTGDLAGEGRPRTAIMTSHPGRLTGML